ncbi:MAG: zinc-dependent metalloprotease, partial [Pseudonocardiales bacterium]|nr:zinc-dependent metalloprotease [Pseudonocardiales bacterium]
QLGGEVLTSTEIGLPLGPEGVAGLLPAAIEQFAAGVERKSSEVIVFLAAREAAHHRLFGHVAWLRQRLLDTVEQFAHGIRIDTDALSELARQVDPSDPQSMHELLSSGLLEQQHSPEQKAALSRLETLLALVEGWVDVVVAEAVGERLPGAEALRETLRRRRASGGPAEHTFATLVGLELRPRKLRAAADLWRRLTEVQDIERRDALWSHPDLLPTTEELDDPAAFVDRAARHAADLDDPIAALERTAADAPHEQQPPDDPDSSGEGPAQPAST